MNAAQTRPGRGADGVMIRLPDGMRDQIKRDAEAAGRSMNAEIVNRLQRTGRVRTPATVKGDAELNASTLRCAMNWALDVLAELCEEVPHPTGDITERCFALPQVQSWNCFGGYPHSHGFDSLTHAVSFLFSNDLGEMRCWDDHPGYEDVLTVNMWALDEKACKPA